MQGVNPQTGKERRNDRHHTMQSIASAPPRPAKRITPERLKDGIVGLALPEKGPVHPLRFPPSVEPSQIDWKAGREYYDRIKGTIRLASEADVQGIVSWALPKFQNRYPRATEDSVLPFLRNATRARHLRFFVSDNGASLWNASRTPWEPELTVSDVFVVVKEPNFAAVHAMRHYLAGLAWAQEVGAVEFFFAASTDIDLVPIARRIGYDHRSYGFAKRLVPLPA